MTYYAAKQVAPSDTIFSNDIGCYTLGFFKPYQMVDTCVCMGASVSMPSGYNVASDQATIAFCGDSTFFHSGMTGLTNAVFNKHKFVLVVLDNTALTGQPMQHIDIEKVVAGLGVKNIQVVKPKNLKKTAAVIEEALNYEGVSVIISREPCSPLIKTSAISIKNASMTGPVRLSTWRTNR